MRAISSACFWLFSLLEVIEDLRCIGGGGEDEVEGCEEGRLEAYFSSIVMLLEYKCPKKSHDVHKRNPVAKLRKAQMYQTCGRSTCRQRAKRSLHVSYEATPHGVSFSLCYPTFCRSYLNPLHTSLMHPITKLLFAFSRPRRSATSFNDAAGRASTALDLSPPLTSSGCKPLTQRQDFGELGGGSGEGHGMANGSSGALTGKEWVSEKWEGGIPLLVGRNGFRAKTCCEALCSQ